MSAMMSKTTPTNRSQSSKIKDDDDATAPVKSKEVLNEILKELANSSQFKSVLQGIIGTVTERILAKV